MKVSQFLALGILPILVACATPITAESIARSEAPQASRDQALQLLERSVELANDFLASEYRLSLPPAQYETAEDGTLVFVTQEKRWPIRIYNSFGGELVVLFGYRAQERDDGFVVGSYPPNEFPEIDNSMFRYSDGDWVPASSVARLLLHETAHTIYGEGTVGYWNTVKYYAEAIFMLRSNDHSDERIPQAVSMEFFLYTMVQEAADEGHGDLEVLYRESFDKHRKELSESGLLEGRFDRSSSP